MSLAGRIVLVTGAGGFIGSHLVEALVEAGASVRALVRYSALGSRGWLDAVAPGVEIVHGDVRDAASVDAAVRGASVVFHLAALVSVPYSFAAPEAVVDTIVKGTLHVLTAARAHAVERVVVTSSSEVYGTARTVPIDETHPLQAQSPYAAAKIAADKLAESFGRAFDTPVTVVRPFNAYGPRQSARAVIPTIITQLVAGRPLRLGSLAPRRDFTYVADLAAAFVAAAACQRAVGEELNVASGREVSIGELAGALISRIAPGTEILEDRERLRPERAEVQRLLGSAARLRALTGWEPRWSLERGLDATVAWFRDPAHLRLGRYDAAVHQV